MTTRVKRDGAPDPAENALAANARYDYERYAKHSFVHGGRTRDHRRAIIRILTHYIEGGMCFPDVRLGYGVEKANSILDKLETYVDEGGPDDTVSWALKTLEHYLEFHASRGMPMPDLEGRVGGLREHVGELQAHGGAEEVTRKQIEEATDFDFRRFLLARHSVRQYTADALDDATIRRIVRNAQECSSVCNRQAVRVYAFNEYTVVQELLAYQAGNAGFRQEIRTLLIITADMAQMNLVGERYQGWIDGGIFAQTLALSIHAEGLGACFLNWSVEKETDMALRERVGIGDNELVITFMSAGHLKESFHVPMSARKPLETVLSLNPPITESR